MLYTSPKYNLIVIARITSAVLFCKNLGHIKSLDNPFTYQLISLSRFSWDLN